MPKDISYKIRVHSTLYLVSIAQFALFSQYALIYASFSQVIKGLRD